MFPRFRQALRDRASTFRLEALEQRILMSADPVLAVIGTVTDSGVKEAVVVEMHPMEQQQGRGDPSIFDVAIDQVVTVEVDCDPASSALEKASEPAQETGTPESQTPSSAPTGAELQTVELLQTAPSNGPTQDAQVQGEIQQQADQSSSVQTAAGLNSPTSDSHSVDTFQQIDSPANPLTQQLTDTLRAANGPPENQAVIVENEVSQTTPAPASTLGGGTNVLSSEGISRSQQAISGALPPILQAPDLSGLTLKNQDLTRLAGQVFYLDVDGAIGVTYDGPVKLTDLNIPAFKGPGALAGQESLILESSLAKLNEMFAGLNVTFTMDRPQTGEFSTIYIGGDDSRFRSFGAFLGLAENVDVGNLTSNDDALVFSGNMQVSGSGGFVGQLVSVVAHEAGRLLGYASSKATTGGLFEVANGDNAILGVFDATTGAQLTKLAADVNLPTSGVKIRFSVNAPGDYSFGFNLDQWQVASWATVQVDGLGAWIPLDTSLTTTFNPLAEKFEFALNGLTTGLHDILVKGLVAGGAAGTENGKITLDPPGLLNRVEYSFTFQTTAILNEVSLPETSGYLHDLLSAGMITGATIITHGWQPPTDWIGLNPNGDSLISLGQAIAWESGRATVTGNVMEGKSWILDYDLTPEDGGGLLNTAEGGQGEFWLGASPVVKAGAAGELIYIFDWAVESNELTTTGWAAAAGEALFAQLVDFGLVNPAAGTALVPLHFIAHSFGNAVMSKAVELLAAYKVPVDQMTFLDAHDFSENIAGFDDAAGQWKLGLPQAGNGAKNTGYGATVWNNVRFADAYYQTEGMGASVAGLYGGIPNGRPVPGAVNFNTNDFLDSLNPHSQIWGELYTGTVLSGGTYSGSRYGWGFSRLAMGGTVQESLRPAPTFYGPDPVFGKPQDHKFSLTALFKNGDPAQGPVFTTGSQEVVFGGITYTRALVEGSHLGKAEWAPRWRPLADSISNGNLNILVGEKGVVEYPFIVPGWSHHGGGRVC